MRTKRKFEEMSSSVLRNTPNEEFAPLPKKPKLNSWGDPETMSVTESSTDIDTKMLDRKQKRSNLRNNLGKRGVLQRYAGKKTSKIPANLRTEVSCFKARAL